MNNNVTIVTGLWNLGRDKISDDFKRPYDSYLKKFAELLRTPSNMVIYVADEDVEFVWSHRSRENTYVRVIPLDELMKNFEFAEQVERIRTNPEWFTQTDWLTRAPQTTLKEYNPLVMSKFFLLNDATHYNPFGSEYFFWIDAGIANTVHPGYFFHDGVFDNLPKYVESLDNRLLFLSYPYVDGQEIHGFPREKMNSYCDTAHVKYVCRGGFFGGHKKQINDINALYHNYLSITLNENLMGTEESIFTILSHKHLELVHRFEIGGDGLIWPFFEALKDVDQLISKTKIIHSPTIIRRSGKTNLYVLGFNSPNQFKAVCSSFTSSDPIFLKRPNKYLIDNSTDKSTELEYNELCLQYGFTRIPRENLGVCGGRQFAAEHADEDNADYHIFFEDDMLMNPNTDTGFCRSGFRKFIPGLYEKVHRIMVKNDIDFLKFSFSEFYLDNNIQVSWYNVPQTVRSTVWPEYDKLPEHGFDANCPRVQFGKIEIEAGVPYITGQVYYGNWPQIVSKEGNKKMFLTTKWARPYEQTWMSYIFQETLAGRIKPAILLASPITHNRFEHYEGTLRKES